MKSLKDLLIVETLQNKFIKIEIYKITLKNKSRLVYNNKEAEMVAAANNRILVLLNKAIMQKL
jgi:hypothetical protein